MTKQEKDLLLETGSAMIAISTETHLWMIYYSNKTIMKRLLYAGVHGNHPQYIPYNNINIRITYMFIQAIDSVHSRLHLPWFSECSIAVFKEPASTFWLVSQKYT